jgi:general secretion pathway protein G
MKEMTMDDGFTFLETLIVLAITVILSAGIGIPAMQQIERAKRTAAREQIETFRIALQNYYLDCHQYPEADQGLDALFEKPILSPVPASWNGPYLDRRSPPDPWGRPYEYSRETTSGLPFVVVSRGSDGKEGGSGNEADIISDE